LVDAARAGSDRVVATIFVNPLQFRPGEDLARYPRDLARDQGLLAARGVDLMFVPSVAEMYPIEPTIRVDPGPLGGLWEGAVRPGPRSRVIRAWCPITSRSSIRTDSSPPTRSTRRRSWPSRRESAPPG